MSSFDAILSDLQAGRYAPVYFLQGEEPYFIDLIAGFIEEHALPEQARGFNQTVVYGRDVAVADILNHARRFPMMSERQVVIVKEAQNIGDLAREAGQKMLEKYLVQPQPSTILVLCYKYKTLDKRRTLYKTIEKNAVFFDARKLYDNQLPGWIQSYVRAKGQRITEKAVHMLADYIGNNLERLSNEIDKILINFNGTVEITDAHVQQFVGISKEYNVFELQRAIASGNRSRAFAIAAYFEANPKNNPVIPVIAILFTFFSRLLLLHHTGCGTEQKAAALLKVNPFFAREYLDAMRHYPLTAVIRNIGHLRLADLQSKGVGFSGGTESEILRELIFKLMYRGENR
jgi:DNA polymerase III subunit delta